MNYSCPNHQINGHCDKLDKLCHPTQKGCLLEGKVKLAAEQEQTDQDDKNALPTEP